MKKARFSEEQIINILKEGEAGGKVGELCRRHGISDATFYTWRKGCTARKGCRCVVVGGVRTLAMYG